MRRIISAFFLAAFALGAAAQTPESLARYAYLAPGSSHAQRHPLQVTLTQIRLPQEVATVGEALTYLLERSGYRLDAERSHWAQTILMPQPLPEVHRDFGPIHLADALGVLTGDAWRLKVNPLYRTLIIEPTHEWLEQLEQPQTSIEIERAEDMERIPHAYVQPMSTSEHSPPAADATLDLSLPTHLHDPAEIFVDDMTLQQALDLLVPVGWRLRPEVQPALLQTRISLIASSTWWDALTELARQLGRQTHRELLLHVFEDQRLVVLEES